MRKRTGALSAAVCSLVLLSTSPAEASVIWDGDASRGTGVFSSLLCDSPGSVVAQDNNDGRGKVFKFNKPLGLERCEAHGISVGGSRYTFKNNSTYYLGWDTSTNTPDAGTIFQWKSYGTGDQHQQNYPVLMKVEGGVLKLFHIEVGEKWTLKWSTPITTSTYKRIVLGIHTSSSASSGWVEAYYNGSKAASFSGRTWDDLGNDTRFGTYGAEVKDKRVINWIDGLKVGTSYGDVDSRTFSAARFVPRCVTPRSRPGKFDFPGLDSKQERAQGGTASCDDGSRTLALPDRDAVAAGCSHLDTVVAPT